MAEQDVVLEIALHEPFVPARRASVLALVALSVSALVHGIAIFALLRVETARAVDGGALEIPVDIVVEASASEPAEVEPPPISTLTTAENEPPPALPEIAATEPSPPSDVGRVQAADAAAEPVAPRPEPIAVSSPIEPAQADSQRQEELQRRPRKEAEAKKQEEAAARKQADAKKREQMRTSAQAAMVHDREATLERSARAPALSYLASAPGPDLVGYHSAVLRHLAAFKHYPETARARGAHGQTVVTFALDNAGHVVSAGILRSSGQADIDAETLAMVRRAEPFPAPPPAAQRSFSAAIEFQLE